MGVVHQPEGLPYARWWVQCLGFKQVHSQVPPLYLFGPLQMLINLHLNGVTIIWNAHKHEMLENRKDERDYFKCHHLGPLVMA